MTLPVREKGCPDTGRQMEFLVFPEFFSGKFRTDPVQLFPNVVRLHDIFHQYSKFIPADSSDNIVIAELRFQFGSEFGNDLVTEGMSILVIDRLETVDIKYEISVSSVGTLLFSRYSEISCSVARLL